MSLGPDDWKRIREIFDGAVSVEPSRRGGYVEAACGADDGLKSEVEALLESHERADGFCPLPTRGRLSPNR